jgi:predicted amidohydrolase
VYRKVHLDYKERAVFEPGSGFAVVGSSVGLACCYDVAFPESARLLTLAGARLIVFPMAWEKRRAYVMEQTAAARAIENVCYVACVNQTGSGGGFEFHGRSTDLDPLARPVARLAEEEGLAVADVDLDWVVELRRSPDGAAYPLLADRRPDVYDALP